MYNNEQNGYDIDLETKPLIDFIKNDDLNKKLSNIETIAKIIWEKDAIFHKFFTFHGLRHIKNVNDNVNLLVPYEIKKKLNENEIFLLLASIWLHDVGMLYIEEHEDPDNEDILKQIREEHHIRSEKFIHKRLGDYGIRDDLVLDMHERSLVGEIVRSHCEDQLPIKDSALRLDKIRIPFLSALLRLGDVCDTTYTRISNIQQILPFPEESKIHWIEKDYISSISLEKDNGNYEIIIHGNIPKNNALKHEKIIEILIFNKIKHEIQKSLKVFSKNGYSLTNAKLELRKNPNLECKDDELLEKFLNDFESFDYNSLNEIQKQILERLCNGTLNQLQLSSELNVTPRAVENLLKPLVNLGLIREEIAEKNRYYYTIDIAMKSKILK